MKAYRCNACGCWLQIKSLDGRVRCANCASPDTAKVKVEEPPLPIMRCGWCDGWPPCKANEIVARFDPRAKE